MARSRKGKFLERGTPLKSAPRFPSNLWQAFELPYMCRARNEGASGNQQLELEVSKEMSGLSIAEATVER